MSGERAPEGHELTLNREGFKRTMDGHILFQRGCNLSAQTVATLRQAGIPTPDYLMWLSRSSTFANRDLSKMSRGRSTPTPALGTSTIPKIFICMPQTLRIV